MPRLGLRLRLLFILSTCLWLTVSCRSPQIGEEIVVTIIADGTTREINLTAGSTVTQALQSAGIVPGNLDQTEPPFYTLLSNGDNITLTRVVELFETEQVVIPFERQIVRNETLPEGETRL
ncbi:MAG: ubiquitin-like domain-containing protein, partial [Anaerolineales bacterium]|nr:ubiquitin-like domain-containing protein [Anaerolineales bacterium]